MACLPPPILTGRSLGGAFGGFQVICGLYVSNRSCNPSFGVARRIIVFATCSSPPAAAKACSHVGGHCVEVAAALEPPLPPPPERRLPPPPPEPPAAPCNAAN